MENKAIYVYENWKSENASLIGIINVEEEKGKQIISFEYAIQWLEDLTNPNIDPDLQKFSGRQYVPFSKINFGAFADSSPDRWGRLLMKRREAILAKRENRKPKSLSEIDFLIGVYDETRMGGLRFSLSENGDFISNDKDLSTPPWTTLRKLESASLSFEKNDDTQEEKWINQLIAPGSSLGGARPKATVLSPDNSLWIAKFPSKNDEFDIGAWEMVVHDLAALCELNVPEAKLEKFSKLGSTFLTKRFDRNGKKRIHFASAMTLLGKTDGASAVDGSSYLDIASFIKQNGSSPKNDLHELWRRIVFNMAVSNTDDHLRNHGFILEKNGWKLSPLYDVNPTIYGDTLSLNVDSNSNLIDFELAKKTSEMFGLNIHQAEEELSEMKNIIESNWKTIASKYGISRSEIEKMSPAFDMRFK